MVAVEPARKSTPQTAMTDRITPQVIGEQLHELATASGEFEKYLGRALTVNHTDLSAMEHLITDGPLTPSELSRRLAISTAAATVMVDRLVELGHVRREPHERDRRMIVVVPSESSVHSAMRAMTPMLTGVAAVTERLSPADRQVVSDFLRDVIQAYRAAN